jgi:hypothetical protein
MSHPDRGDIHAFAECIRRAKYAARGLNGLQERVVMLIWHKSRFDIFLPLEMVVLSYLS